MLGLRVYLEGDQIAARELESLGNRAADLTPAWPRVLAALHEITKRAFDTEGASTTAGPWPQLADRTQRERAAEGYGPAHPILQRTRTLYDALTSDSADQETVKLPHYFAKVIHVDYFPAHQSNRPRTRLPRRAPVSLTQDDKTALLHPIRLYVTGRDPGARRRGPAR